MALSRLPPQSYKPALDIRIHVLPAHQLIIPHLIHAQGIPMRSFVANFLRAYWVHARQVSQSILDTAGVAWSAAPGSASLRQNAGIGISTFGIQVGAGGLPPTPSDYRLGTPIVHGSGANQLSYGGMSFVDPYIAGDITYAAVARTLTNTSGGSIYVSEIGLICVFNIGSADRFFLIARDLLISTITWPPTVSKQMIYTYATEV